MATTQPSEGIFRQGWLTKQGSMFKGSKSRWVSIQGGFFYMYKTAEDIIPSCKHHIMSAIVTKADVAGVPHCFHVNFSSARTSFTFQATSATDLEGWLSDIQKAKDACKSRVASIEVATAQRGTATLNTLDDQGNALIHRLAYFGRDLDLNALIDQGANINLPNIRGDTALHLGVLEGRDKTVQLLLKRGAKVELIDKRGCTPLHLAALAGREKIVGFLLESGANPFHRHANGKLPIDMAQKRKVRDMLTAACQGRPTQEIFGKLLSDAISIRQTIEPNATLPYIIEDTISYLEKNAMDIEGIFRISGSASEVQSWKEKYQSGYRLDLTKVVDPNSISGVLKLYLRELLEPIVPYESYEEFIELGKESPIPIEQLMALVEKLPKYNLSILRKVINFLHVVAKNEPVNKMSSGNLAVVFGPNLIRPKDPSVFKIMNDNPSIQKLISALIDCGFEKEAVQSPPANPLSISISTPESVHFGRQSTAATDIEDDEHVPVTFLSVSALYDFEGEPGNNDLSFKTGEIILVLQQGDDGWWFGSLNGRTGFFPCNFVAYLDPIESLGATATLPEDGDEAHNHSEISSSVAQKEDFDILIVRDVENMSAEQLRELVQKQNEAIQKLLEKNKLLESKLHGNKVIASVI